MSSQRLSLLIIRLAAAALAVGMLWAALGFLTEKSHVEPAPGATCLRVESDSDDYGRTSTWCAEFSAYRRVRGNEPAPGIFWGLLGGAIIVVAIRPGILLRLPVPKGEVPPHHDW